MVDIIVSYKIIRKGQDKPLILKALNMIYPKTTSFKIVQYSYKQSSTIAKIVDQACICRYTRPTVIV